MTESEVKTILKNMYKECSSFGMVEVGQQFYDLCESFGIDPYDILSEIADES